jgi:hypothetical protein
LAKERWRDDVRPRNTNPLYCKGRTYDESGGRIGSPPAEGRVREECHQRYRRERRSDREDAVAAKGAAHESDTDQQLPPPEPG